MSGGGLQVEPSACEMLAELAAGAGPRCARCTEKSIAKITYSERFGRRQIWSEVHTCDAHFDQVIDWVQDGGLVKHVKWFR